MSEDNIKALKNEHKMMKQALTAIRDSPKTVDTSGMRLMARIGLSPYGSGDIKEDSKS